MLTAWGGGGTADEGKAGRRGCEGRGPSWLAEQSLRILGAPWLHCVCDCVCVCVCARVPVGGEEGDREIQMVRRLC